jgi:alkaline phosphatase D
MAVNGGSAVRSGLARRCSFEALEARICSSSTPNVAPGSLIFDAAQSVTAASQLSVGPFVGAVSAHSGKFLVRTATAGSVKIEYSTQADFSTSKFTALQSTSATSDFTTIQTVSGLIANTRYYYRAYVNGQLQPTALHTFKTFPEAGAASTFSFAVASDLINVANNPTIGAPVYQRMAADHPLFMMQIGDFDHRNPGSLAAMRTMHRQVLGTSTASGADFDRYIARNMPVFHIWDDHDYGMNNGDKTFPGRTAALQAFREYYPRPNVPNPAGVWQSFSAGQADLLMLDVRSQRDPASIPDGPSKSMLDGDNIANGQKAWLKAALLNSTATWKFIVSGVTFNPTTKPDDAWGAYGSERTELLNFIRNNHITGVVFISGDLHSGGGIDNGVNAGVPEITVPHTNLDTNQNGSGPLGIWSQGIISGINNPGYALITVTGSQAILQVKGVDGTVKKSLTLSASVERIVDDGDAGFSTVGDWGIGNPAGAYQADQHYSAKGTGADAATWQVGGLPAGSYEVFVRWAGSGTLNRASNAPFSVQDGSSLLGTALINQQVAPNSTVVNGVSWQRLGLFKVGSGTLKITLRDKADGYVFADAVRVIRSGAVSAALTDGQTSRRDFRPGSRLSFGDFAGGASRTLPVTAREAFCELDAVFDRVEARSLGGKAAPH